MNDGFGPPHARAIEARRMRDINAEQPFNLGSFLTTNRRDIAATVRRGVYTAQSAARQAFGEGTQGPRATRAQRATGTSRNRLEELRTQRRADRDIPITPGLSVPLSSVRIDTAGQTPIADIPRARLPGLPNQPPNAPDSELYNVGSLVSIPGLTPTEQRIANQQFGRGSLEQAPYAIYPEGMYRELPVPQALISELVGNRPYQDPLVQQSVVGGIARPSRDMPTAYGFRGPVTPGDVSFALARSPQELRRLGFSEREITAMEPTTSLLQDYSGQNVVVPSVPLDVWYDNLQYVEGVSSPGMVSIPIEPQQDVTTELRMPATSGRGERTPLDNYNELQRLREENYRLLRQLRALDQLR